MNLELLIDLHRSGERQGPGSEFHTRLALQLSNLEDREGRLNIADIGCGTGSSAFVLANALDADITAIDFSAEFMETLKSRALSMGFENRITPICCSMEKLPFEQESLDVIWSEGAIYNLGFEKGIREFKQFMKRGAILAVSEITWLTQERPPELVQYWMNAYPEIASASKKIAILEEQGFILKGYFPLPEQCWIQNYYEPLTARFDDFLQRHDCDDARSLIDAEREEIELYKRYRRYYSYGFYIAELL